MYTSVTRVIAAVACSGCVLVSCAQAPLAPSPVEGRLQVTDIEFQVARPPTSDAPVIGDVTAQLRARIAGWLPDSCTELGRIEQRRDGNVVTVTITTTRPANVACAQVVRSIEAAVIFDGTFAAGEYVVRANGFEVRVTL